MLGFSRRSASYTFTAAMVLLLLYLVYLIRSTLFVFVLALLFAYLLTPLVNLLDRVLPGRTRTPALALSYLIFIGLTAFVLIEIGSTVVGQATALGKKIPEILANWQQPSPHAAPEVNSMKDQLLGKARTEIAKRSSDLVSALPQFGLRFLSVASDALYIVIIPILAFFFLKDGKAMRTHVLEIVDQGPRRRLLDEILADIDLLLAHYMRALFGLSLAAFTSYSIFFSIMGVPYGVLLAAIGGMLEFIPMLGPLTAAVIILAVAGVAGSHVLAILIFLLVYRLFQDYMLSPNLMGSGVELHPLLILFGVFAGAEIAGIAGTFLSVPVLALVRILYLRLRSSRLAARVV
ncbi:MAG TPA: AI-2E family transporter [Bryobacteraceae bacterium]|jgi:predicted PurR-regulated permease PerM|nr:AI-2E family transporter [Bryobacteraceae bacterium]